MSNQCRERLKGEHLRMKTISFFYCLLYATWTEGVAIDVEGFEGGEVSFRCSHRLAWNNNKYLCKDPCKGSEDILLSVAAGWTAASGRITLVDSGDGVFTVTFSQLQPSDSGRYWCAVERPGYDTYTSVHLTVKEAVANEKTTCIPKPSPAWTNQTMSNSKQLTTGIDTSRPTNLTTASNYTDGRPQDSSTGSVFYATIGVVVVMMAILLLAACYWKRREKSKPQPQVGCNSTELVGADEREADNVYDEIGEEVHSIQKLSEGFFCTTHHPKVDPSTSSSTTDECSVPFHIYENVCCSKAAAGSRHSAANVQDKPDVNSPIYIQTLPHTISETTGDGSLGTHIHTPASAHHSKSHSESMEGRPRSLWFGLDLSGTV